MCVCEGERQKEEKMFYAIVFAHVPPSVCQCVYTFTSKCMNMHVCVHIESDVLSQQRLITP